MKCDVLRRNVLLTDLINKYKAGKHGHKVYLHRTTQTRSTRYIARAVDKWSLCRWLTARSTHDRSLLTVNVCFSEKNPITTLTIRELRRTAGRWRRLGVRLSPLCHYCTRRLIVELVLRPISAADKRLVEAENDGLCDFKFRCSSHYGSTVESREFRTGTVRLGRSDSSLQPLCAESSLCTLRPRSDTTLMRTTTP